MTTNNLLLRRFFLVLIFLTVAFKSFADENSYGYQLALLNERAQNPQNVLLQKKITPPNATVREFEWILETLTSRCRDPQNIVITTLVESWRVVQRRGYNVTLLEFSRQNADFSNIAFQSMRNQKLDIDKVTRKLLKNKYPIKK